jgi:hypothetical protein
MTKTAERERRRTLAALRSQWRTWKDGGPHPAYALVCPERCGQPECEACAATAYRADRMAEITARAQAIAGTANARPLTPLDQLSHGSLL